MNGNDKFVSSMPSWDTRFIGPRNEADQSFQHKNFWGGYGFSDQVYLIKTKVFKQSGVWHYRHIESDRYPIGDTFEKKIDAFMRNADKWRLVHKKSWYEHRSRSGHTYKLLGA